jgi:FkbM family methyltransferase
LKRLAATVLLALRVKPSLSFTRRQMRGEPGIHEYRLRRSGATVLIRHDADDPYVLAECFGRLAQYDPPPPVAAALEAAPPARVVDLGGNIGLFGLLAAERWPKAELVSFEPDPSNSELLDRVIAANDMGSRWRLIRAAAAPAPATLRFAAGRSSRSHAVEGEGPQGETIEVEAIDAFPELAGADLIKIDIEGGEWGLLSDPRLPELAARVIVLEYHGAGCPEDDARAAALSLLGGAGYRVETLHERPASADPREGLGVAWAWRA